MNAYDDLSAFQFKSGKGYEKRSVEEFRASALTAVDDLLRVNVQLQDRLAGPAGPLATAQPVAALHPEEQHLLVRYRAMTTSQRSELLRELEADAPAAIQAAESASSAKWTEPPGWTMPVTPVPGALVQSPRPQAPSISWDSPVSSAPPLTAPPSIYTQPDWLTEWESLSPDQTVPPVDEPGTYSPSANDWHTVVASDITPDSGLGWSRDDMAPPTWDTVPAASPFAPPATLPPFMPPPHPSNEVGVPLTADSISPAPDRRYDESPLSQDHLDDLFNQLDFGPPSVDLLPHGGLIQSDTSPHAAPLHVASAPDSDQPLPPPVRPWEGWIR